MVSPLGFFIFFFNDTATTEIYTLSLHDALPISPPRHVQPARDRARARAAWRRRDRKSTRLNSSHANISYAVFCLKKKNNTHDDAHEGNKILVNQHPVVPDSRDPPLPGS